MKSHLVMPILNGLLLSVTSGTLYANVSAVCPSVPLITLERVDRNSSGFHYLVYVGHEYLRGRRWINCMNSDLVKIKAEKLNFDAYVNACVFRIIQRGIS